MSELPEAAEAALLDAGVKFPSSEEAATIRRAVEVADPIIRKRRDEELRKRLESRVNLVISPAVKQRLRAALDVFEQLLEADDA